MKGIILAGGAGTRLYPLSKVITKPLLPVYDKPMVYYPLSTLMLAEINDILIISTPEDLPAFERLLGDGSRFGIRLSYKEQPSPDGIADAFLLGEEFVGDDRCALILGDNIFFGDGFRPLLADAVANAEAGNATIFGYYVPDPERFGVAEFDKDGNVLSVEEKPKNPKSNYCITGLYFYDNRVVNYAKSIEPSARGELEITDVNRLYLQDGTLKVKLLDESFSWLDTGTMDSLAEATALICDVEKDTGKLISAPEAVAFENGWISPEQLYDFSKEIEKSPYGASLKKLSGK